MAGGGLFEHFVFNYGVMFVAIAWILMATVNIGFAAAVYVDGVGLTEAARRSGDERSGTVMVPPILWTLAVLIGGVFVAAVYWLMHHSALVQTGRIDVTPQADEVAKESEV